MDRSRRTRLLGVTMLATSVIATGTTARAEPHDPALAQALFDEATKLYEEGLKSHDNAKLAAACAKFEASHRTDPGYGAAFNLATCDEAIGKTASAWAAFLEAAALAKTQGDAADAKRRADAIAVKLVRLKIVVTPPNEGVVIKRDGAVQDRAAWGTEVPVDPGSHPVTAEAPGKQSWSTSAATEGEGKVITIEVPALLDAAPTASVSPTSDASRPIGAQRGIALGVGGLGVLGLVVGGVLAGTAKSKWDEAKPHCDEQHRCDSFGLSTGQEARALADGATVPFVVGGLALAAGVVLWLTAPASTPTKPPPSATAHAWVGHDGGGLLLRGAF